MLNFYNTFPLKKTLMILTNFIQKITFIYITRDCQGFNLDFVYLGRSKGFLDLFNQILCLHWLPLLNIIIHKGGNYSRGFIGVIQKQLFLSDNGVSKPLKISNQKFNYQETAAQTVQVNSPHIYHLTIE